MDELRDVLFLAENAPTTPGPAHGPARGQSLSPRNKSGVTD